MKHKLLYTVLAGLLLASMALTACGAKATSTVYRRSARSCRQAE